MTRNGQAGYFPILETIARELSGREAFTYGDVRPILLEHSLSPQIAWPVLRKKYLQVVERRARQKGHVYRVKGRREAERPLDHPPSTQNQAGEP